MKEKKCPNCGKELEKVMVSVEGAKNKILSYQCDNCDYVDNDPVSSKKVIDELRRKRLAVDMKQKVIKLSQGRLGVYFNKDIIRCLDLKGGEDIYISVPDKKHIVLKIE
ncbi:MAG: hypothetical protein Q8O89_07560 [Nanoarchaeota archaeon]|nr:hypothetical protein [Nanoarchaeota archaeon]